jgi:hypothetical protein
MNAIHAPGVVLALLILTAAPAEATVVDAAAGGFTVRQTVEVSASAAAAYRTLVDRAGEWWQSDHTFSGSAANLSIDARPGGCFCEKLPGGGGVRHLTVVYADAGKLLRLTGGLGPLQDMAVEGTMTWRFAESRGKTTIEMIYKVGGYAPGGFAALAPVVDMVLSTQVGRLKLLIDIGHAQ